LLFNAFERIRDAWVGGSIPPFGSLLLFSKKSRVSAEFAGNSCDRDPPGARVREIGYLFVTI